MLTLQHLSLKKLISALSDSADTGSSVVKSGLCVTAVALAVIVGGYKLLYRFVSIKHIYVDDLKIFKSVMGNYSSCYFKDNYFFDCVLDEYIDEIPVKVDGTERIYFYIPNSSELKLLKTLLRKILRIKIPVS
jgi:hypothetical protein